MRRQVQVQILNLLPESCQDENVVQGPTNIAGNDMKIFISIASSQTTVKFSPTPIENFKRIESLFPRLF